jgi:SAM-dependent methyltransferase
MRGTVGPFTGTAPASWSPRPRQPPSQVSSRQPTAAEHQLRSLPSHIRPIFGEYYGNPGPRRHLGPRLADLATAPSSPAYAGRMPTMPQEQPRASVRESHHYRHVAESFGVDAERYDRARPRYPDALVVVAVVAASPGLDVLDVGCGTGIAARQFQAAGATVLGVEPDARMAEFARHSGVEVEVATFEAWDPAGWTFDAVIAGQSWHWVDPVAGATKAAQVLRSGGPLTLFWHPFEPPPAVNEAFATVYQRVVPVPDSPINAKANKPGMGVWQVMLAKAADGMHQVGGFSDPEQWRFDWEQSYTRQEWLDLLPTTGGLTRRPPDKLAEVLDGVGAAIDKIGGSFTMSYTTVAVTARREPVPSDPA